MIGFCGVNPLKDYALAELGRCAKNPQLRRGLKLHIGYGANEARVFLRELVPAAPDVVIQIAHMAGGGAPGDTAAREALGVFADAMANHEPATKNLYFEVSGTGVTTRTTPEEARLLGAAMRRIGMERVLYGSDGAAGGNSPPREAWAAFRLLPLTSEEFRAIARNVAPYVR